MKLRLLIRVFIVEGSFKSSLVFSASDLPEESSPPCVSASRMVSVGFFAANGNCVRLATIKASNRRRFRTNLSGILSLPREVFRLEWTLALACFARTEFNEVN